jgi:hypothetical protein
VEAHAGAAHVRELCLQQCAKSRSQTLLSSLISGQLCAFSCGLSSFSHPGVGPPAFAHPLPQLCCGWSYVVQNRKYCNGGNFFSKCI